MIRAILTPAEARAAADGTLTEIRRPFPEANDTMSTARRARVGQPGTVLDVAEEYAVEDCDDDGDRLIWRADRAAVWVDDGMILGKAFYLDADYKPACGWQSAETMPPWAVRSRLRITAVRVERAATGWEWVYSVEKAS